MLTHTPKSSTHIKFRNMLVVCLPPIPGNKPLNIQTKAHISHMAHMRLHSKDLLRPIHHSWSCSGPSLVVGGWTPPRKLVYTYNSDQNPKLPLLALILARSTIYCQVLLLNKANYSPTVLLITHLHGVVSEWIKCPISSCDLPIMWVWIIPTIWGCDLLTICWFYLPDKWYYLLRMRLDCLLFYLYTGYSSQI